MFKKIGEVFFKLTVKQLIAVIITSVIIIILELLCWFFDIINADVTLLLATPFACVIGVSVIKVQLIIDTNKVETEQKIVLERLKTELSAEEFTEIQFEPKDAYSQNIKRCLHIFNDLKVTHFAKIDNYDNIIVIAKDSNGNPSTPEIMNPLFFSENYKVLK